jgi:formate dehydrogenase subunit gamma
MKLLSRLCLAVLLSVVAGATLAQTQTQDERVKEQQQRQVTQPGNNAPVWREVRSGQSPYTNSTVQGVKPTCWSSPGARPGARSVTGR